MNAMPKALVCGSLKRSRLVTQDGLSLYFCLVIQDSLFLQLMMKAFVSKARNLPVMNGGTGREGGTGKDDEAGGGRFSNNGVGQRGCRASR